MTSSGLIDSGQRRECSQHRDDRAIEGASQNGTVVDAVWRRGVHVADDPARCGARYICVMPSVRMWRVKRWFLLLFLMNTYCTLSEDFNAKMASQVSDARRQCTFLLSTVTILAYAIHRHQSDTRASSLNSSRRQVASQTLCHGLKVGRHVDLQKQIRSDKSRATQLDRHESLPCRTLERRAVLPAVRTYNRWHCIRSRRSDHPSWSDRPETAYHFLPALCETLRMFWMIFSTSGWGSGEGAG